MSTLKSSAENLTLNADGSGNDIIFQSNGSNIATLDQAGLLTATTFAGSGASLTGVGKLLQAVAFVEDSSEQTLATDTYTDTGLSVSITPTLTSSKILCMWNMHWLSSTSVPSGIGVQLVRGVSNVFTSGSNYDMQSRISSERLRGSWMYLDSPSTTSATTYKIQVSSQNGETIYLNDDSNKTQLLLMEIGV